MPYNHHPPTDHEPLTLRHPSPDSPTWTWDDPPSPPTETGLMGTDTPWWPSWDRPAATTRPPRRADHGHDAIIISREQAEDESRHRVVRAAFMREREARLESVHHLPLFATAVAPEEEEGEGPQAVTLLGTAQLLERLAGEVGAGAGVGVDGDRVWAGVDAALTALVVLGCGGARVGAVGVGACVVCYARVADVVLRPCGHAVLCSGCVLVEKVGGKGAGAGKRRQAVCPVPGCGRAVEETLKTYRG